MSARQLYSWGANSHGQLGQGDIPEEELLAPNEVDLSNVAGLDVAKIKKIVGGAGHTLLLDDSGNVFSCGWNDKGQAGTERTSKRFQKLVNLERIVDIACGWDSSMALTDRGELFAWGSNLHGQLGLARLKFTNISTKVELDVPVKKIAIGLRHAAIVTRDSKVLVSGAATKGQLGVDLDAARCSDRFVEVPDLQEINDVACGQHHTVVVTRDNEIFAWGDNKHGQLGVDPELCKVSSTPIKIENLKEIGEINKLYCGWTHSVISTADKKILSWGRNAYGQLGRAKTTPIGELWKAKTASSVSSKKIQQISVGSEHNIALTDDGTIISWGWNEHGNCGNGSDQDTFEPTKVLLPDCRGILVGSGAGHSFALVQTKSS